MPFGPHSPACTLFPDIVLRGNHVEAKKSANNLVHSTKPSKSLQNRPSEGIFVGLHRHFCGQFILLAEEWCDIGLCTFENRSSFPRDSPVFFLSGPSPPGPMSAFFVLVFPWSVKPRGRLALGTRYNSCLLAFPLGTQTGEIRSCGLSVSAPAVNTREVGGHN